jgi:integrase
VVRDFAAGRYLEELPEVAEQFKTKLMNPRPGEKPLLPASINRYLAIMRRVGNLAVKWGWTDLPLGKRIEMLPGEASRHVYLTTAQVKVLAAAASPALSDLIMLAALTGLRRSELLRLTPQSVVDKTILLDANTKSGRPRAIPLPPQAVRVAKRLPITLTPREIRRDFLAARIAAGLPHVRFHDLRHTYASWLVQGGAGLTAVRDLLGHSSLAVTSRYSHLGRPDLVAATRKLKV